MPARMHQHKRIPGYWDVEFCGRRIIEAESYQIASEVVYYLNNPNRDDGSETHEVARNALRAGKGC